MHARNRRRVTGRTNLKQHQEVSDSERAALVRRRPSFKREQDAKAKKAEEDEKVVDRLVDDLRVRFYDKGSLAKSFRGLDYDYSGTISLDELKSFLDHLGHQLTTDQVQLLLSRTDKDMNNSVDMDEFCAIFDVYHQKDEQGRFSNVNQSIGELDARSGELEAKGGAGGQEKVGSEEEGDKAEQGGQNGGEGPNAASTSSAADNEAEHYDVMVRVHSIVSQLKRKVAQKGSMRTVFREYDANHDGSISRDEFRDALNNLNLIVTDKELDALLSLVDSHHTNNQEIMYDDFCAKFGDEQQLNEDFSQGNHSLPDFTSAKHKAAALTPKLTELATRLQSGSGLVCYAKILKAFRDFDSEKVGRIARDDFRMAIDRVSRLGATTGLSSSVAWESEVDHNGGYVDYVAFVERLRQAGVSRPADFWTPLTVRNNGNGNGSVSGGSSALDSEGHYRDSYHQGSYASGSGSQSGSASPWVSSPMQRPTRFQNSTALRYKNTSYITVPQEGSPSYVGHEERFRTSKQGGIMNRAGVGAKNGKFIPEAKAERIRKNQARIDASLKEEANRKMQQETARIDSLSMQRQNYLDRVNQASFQKGRFVRAQVGVSQANILTGLTE